MATALSLQNRESELSYAYIHAVAAHAGMDCAVSSRHQDNAGVDATITAWGDFPGSLLTEVKLSVQLKATISSPTESKEGLSYFFKGVRQYDALRSGSQMVPRILVVLFLPADENLWVEQTSDCLALRKCAYWCSLEGAPATSNDSGVTIKLPHANMFNADSLKSIIGQIARGERLPYEDTESDHGSTI